MPAIEPPIDFAKFREYVLSNPDLSSEEIGRRVVGEMTEAEIRGLAAAVIAADVKAARRTDLAETEEVSA
jgi:hypothetical protein